MHAGIILGITLPMISIWFLQASILVSEEEEEDVCIGLDGVRRDTIDKLAKPRVYDFNGSVDVLLLIEASIYSVPYLAATIDGDFNDEDRGFLAQLKSQLSDVRVAVSGYTNKPRPLAGPGPFCGWNEFAPSYCYRNFSPFTRDMLAVSEAFGHLIGSPIMIGQPSKVTNTLRGNMFEGILNAIHDQSLDWRVFGSERTAEGESTPEDSPPMTPHQSSIESIVQNKQSGHADPRTQAPSDHSTCPAGSSSSTHSLHSTSATHSESPPNATKSPQVLNEDQMPPRGNLIREHTQCDLSSGKLVDQCKAPSDVLKRNDSGDKKASMIQVKEAISDKHMNIVIVLFNVLSHTEHPKEEFEEYDVTNQDWTYVEYDAGENILRTAGGYPSCAWRRADPELAYGIFEGDYHSFDNTASLGIYADLIKTLQYLSICFSAEKLETKRNETMECVGYYRDSLSFVEGIFNLTHARRPHEDGDCRGPFPSYEDVIAALDNEKHIRLAALIGSGQNNPFVYYDDCRALGNDDTFESSECYSQWAATYLPNATIRTIPPGIQDLTNWLTEVVLDLIDTV